MSWLREAKQQAAEQIEQSLSEMRLSHDNYESLRSELPIDTARLDEVLVEASVSISQVVQDLISTGYFVEERRPNYQVHSEVGSQDLISYTSTL